EGPQGSKRAPHKAAQAEGEEAAAAGQAAGALIMGAPAKSTGGVQSAKDAPGRRTRGSGRGEGAPSRSEGAGRLARADTPILSAKARPSRKQEGDPPDRPPRGRSGGLPKPPQGHSGYRRKVQRKP